MQLPAAVGGMEDLGDGLLAVGVDLVLLMRLVMLVPGRLWVPAVVPSKIPSIKIKFRKKKKKKSKNKVSSQKENTAQKILQRNQ